VAVDSPSERVADRGFRMTVRLNPPEHCPVKRVDGEPANIWVDVVDDEMRCDLMTAAPDGEGHAIRHFRKPIDEECPCRIFQRHDAIPQLSVERRYIRTTVYLDEADRGQRLVTDLTGSVADVDVTDFETVDGPVDPPVVPVDRSALTHKQRQALELATEVGYYDLPAAATIEDMAEILDISPSALGKRLRRAERSVITQVTGDE